MAKTIIIAAIVFITLSQCGDGLSGGSPVNKVVKVNKSSASKSIAESNTESASTMNEDQLAKAKEIIASVTDRAITGINAKKVFKTNCASCHGFTGNLGINGSKDLTKSTISLEESVAQVYHGRGLMIPYKDVLSAEELVAVSKYAETLRK